MLCKVDTIVGATIIEWEINVVDESCVFRDVDSGMYLSYQGDSKVSVRLQPSPENTETWRMEDLGRCANDANALHVAFRGISGEHYYLGAALAGWVTLRTHCFKWERWSMHLQ